MAEKEEAFQLAEDGIRAVTALRGKVAPRYQEALRQSFLLLRELARVYRPLLEGLLRYFQFEATLSEVDREHLAARSWTPWPASALPWPRRRPTWPRSTPGSCASSWG